MSLFPFIDTTDTTTETTTTGTTPKEYAWDFKNNEFVLENGKLKVVEGTEAIKVWIYKVLKTQRYRYLAYSWDYGNELEKLIGSGLSKDAIQSEAKRYIEEALSINTYIKSIKDLSVTINEDVMSFDFTAVTDYGEVSISV